MRIKSGSGLGNDVYLRPVHWIMDDSCLRFLEEEEGCRRKMELKRESEEKGEDRKRERERKQIINVDRNGPSVKQWTTRRRKSDMNVG